MKKLLVLVTFLSAYFLNADVVNEYRDYNNDGYITSTFVFHSEGESKQRALETYGEYDITDNIIFTGRLTNGYFYDGEEKVKDKLHIASAGLRFHFPILENFRVGFKTNIVHRDYGGVGGLSYRFMPVLEYDPFSFLNLRYILEYDYIPKKSFKESDKKTQTQKETALYVRIMPGKFLDYKNGFEYELKMASGLGRENGRSRWGLSYEHHLYWNFDNGLKLKYSRVRENGDWGFQTLGLMYEFNF